MAARLAYAAATAATRHAASQERQPDLCHRSFVRGRHLHGQHAGATTQLSRAAVDDFRRGEQVVPVNS